MSSTPAKTAAKVTAIIIAGFFALMLLIGGCAALMGGSDSSSDPGREGGTSQTHDGWKHNQKHDEHRTDPLPGKGTGDHPAKDDVTVGTLHDEGYGTYTQTIVITNHSSKTSDYFVDVAYKDASGTRQGSDVAAETHVKPGETVKSTIAPIDKPASTEVTSVERTESY
jgi:hypothetical protein